MITTKQRAYLRSLANTTESLYQIGKNGITATVIETLSAALESRELIKITVLEACPDTAKTIMTSLMDVLSCEAVQTIGRKVVIYRKSENTPTIVLPK
ncbi:MAG: YhbY family RNA-binding protein [Clostridia bacterium]